MTNYRIINVKRTNIRSKKLLPPPSSWTPKPEPGSHSSSHPQPEPETNGRKKNWTVNRRPQNREHKQLPEALLTKFRF